MAKSTRQYVFEGMELLPKTLTPFVEKRLESAIKERWQSEVIKRVSSLRSYDGTVFWDQQGLLKTMMVFWKEAFADVLGHLERSYISELLGVRNRLSHNEAFSYDDAERALDTMRRLMESISAGNTATEIGKMRDTILRTKYAELQRNEERRKTQRLNISVKTVDGLMPWREVVEPHQDVASGEFRQAEFAADLGKVHEGSAPSEYYNPKEFFSRTYLTDGLSSLLVGAAKRLSQTGGDPIVELQTNFGGGKTHSMLALYHMVNNISTQDLPGLDQLLFKNNLKVPENVNRAVLVGTSRGPQDVLNVDGERKIRTTWGELAWQLGGADAYDMIADNDVRGIAPGSNLLETIFKKYMPCLILIDEWVAYLRQIYKVDNLPSGSFDSNLSFVQSLTEAVKTSPGTLLVAALPASQIESGGEGGKQTLLRLKQTFSRVESSWRPASQEESYEIVRRRLFREVSGDKHIHKDNTLKQFAKLYRENSNEFPQGCSDEDYRRKLEKAYPVHPELFDQLYISWGSMEKFQRTRGVLRLMAQVIHELWMSNDPSVMIMPGNITISSARVEPELLHYLDLNWQSIIASDVDGPNSTPHKIDQSAPNLNRYSATRRVARTIFMGSAPIYKEENKGIDDKQINLGVVQPGERPAIFGDALRRLTNQAKFMHSDLGRYWYSVSASLNRIASDKAEQVEEGLVLITIDQKLTDHINGINDRGHFDTIHVAPSSSADVPDEMGGIRAIVLGVAHSHTNSIGSDALTEAKNILMQRGSALRIFRNTLVFLAAESQELDNLKEAVRYELAWKQIVCNIKSLNLTQSDSDLANKKLVEANETTRTRLRECWCYLIYPHQESAQAEVEWTPIKIPTQDGLLTRASKKLKSNECLLSEIGPTRLARDLQRYIWNDKPHVLLKDLWEYLNRYTYLPRIKNKSVLIKAIQSAVSGMTPSQFAYAEQWDEQNQKYLGLIIEKSANPHIVIDNDSVIVKSDVAEIYRHVPKILEEKAETLQPVATASNRTDMKGQNKQSSSIKEREKLPTRFIGAVMISPDRPARDMHQIVEDIVEHLTIMEGSNVSLKLEIDAEVSSGIDQVKIRTLMENATTLGFIDKFVK